MPRRRVTEAGVWDHYPCPFCADSGLGPDPSYHLGVLTLPSGGQRVLCLRCGSRTRPPFLPRQAAVPDATQTRAEVAAVPTGEAPGIPYLEAPPSLRFAVFEELSQAWPGLTTQSWASLARLYRGELLLPVWSPGRGTGWLRRRLGPGIGPRYLTETGLFPGLPTPFPVRVGLRVILAEGWADAVAWAHATGLVSIVAGGVRPAPQALRALLPHSVEVLIGFDGDEPGRVGARAVARALKREWRAVRVLELPPGTDPAELPAEELRRCLEPREPGREAAQEEGD